MALAYDNANGADEAKYCQWEWQESDSIWRRYPCTISHKLNTIIAGQTIYVTIYEWVYVITKQNKSNGTQTNLFTQHARKIRLVAANTNLDVNSTDEKQTEPQKQLSLYYNYSYANIVLISNLESNELKVKDLFYKSVSNTEYEITLMTQVQLSQNNKQFQTYRKQLKRNCQKHKKRKHEIEALIWSNCTNKQENKLYAHSKHVSQIINNKNNNKQLVYFCRAIYIGHRPNYINARDVITTIPLYLINFRKINIENTFDLLHENDAEFVVDEEDEEAITKSLFVVTSSSPTSYSYSYSQPLLPFMINSPKNINGYGSIQTKNKQNKQNKQNKHKRHKTWHEIMRQQDIEVFSFTFDINVIIGKLLQVRESAPGTLVNLCVPVIENICVFAKTLLMQQPVLLELECPISIVGDIHGQYYDLLRLFSYGQYPPETNYLFLGDYVDRGGQSIECICLLLCYKIKYEENFFLLRGNHECENINRIYGFYDECKRRFSVRIWKKFVDVFNHLPVAAIVSQKIFCVHGGLSPELFLTPLSFDNNIRNVVRPTDIGDYGLVCDLLWSDPSFDIVGFYDNGDRGVSYYFGKDIVDCFNKTFDIDLICRAHQVVEDGYEFFNQRQLVTIFSAPNYCGEFDNCASFMQVDHDLKCSFITMDPQRRYQPMKIKKKY